MGASRGRWSADSAQSSSSPRRKRSSARDARALLVRLAEKDGSTEEHTRRVAQLAVQVGEALGLPPARLRGLALGGILHDVGKLAVPGEAAQQARPAPPTSSSTWSSRHPQAGVRLLRDLGGFPVIRRSASYDTTTSVWTAPATRTASAARRTRRGHPDPRRVRRLRRARLTPHLSRGVEARACDCRLLRDPVLFDQRCVGVLERVIGRERASGLAVAVYPPPPPPPPPPPQDTAPRAPHKRAWRSVAACARTGRRRDASATPSSRPPRPLSSRSACSTSVALRSAFSPSFRNDDSRLPARARARLTRRSGSRSRAGPAPAPTAGLWTFRGTSGEPSTGWDRATARAAHRLEVSAQREHVCYAPATRQGRRPGAASAGPASRT